MPRIVDAPTGMLALAVVMCATAGAPGCYLPVDSANERDATPASPSVDSRSPGTTFGTGGTYDLGGDPGARGGSGAGQVPVPVAPPPPATCPAVAVSRFNELMIIDPGVTNDARASNQAASRPWSFRQRLEALADGTTEAAAAAADAWLAGWSALTDVPVSTTPGAARVPIESAPRRAGRAALPLVAAIPGERLRCDLRRVPHPARGSLARALPAARDREPDRSGHERRLRYQRGRASVRLRRRRPQHPARAAVHRHLRIRDHAAARRDAARLGGGVAPARRAGRGQRRVQRASRRCGQPGAGPRHASARADQRGTPSAPPAGCPGRCASSCPP